MDKEKEIEEVFDIIDDNVYIQNDWLYGKLDAAQAIVEAGYRKSDEVRKETLREIDKLAAECGLDEFRAVELRKYAKQLGIEVDE